MVGYYVYDRHDLLYKVAALGLTLTKSQVFKGGASKAKQNITPKIKIDKTPGGIKKDRLNIISKGDIPELPRLKPLRSNRPPLKQMGDLSPPTLGNQAKAGLTLGPRLSTKAYVKRHTESLI